MVSNVTGSQGLINKLPVHHSQALVLRIAIRGAGTCIEQMACKPRGRLGHE